MSDALGDVHNINIFIENEVVSKIEYEISSEVIVCSGFIYAHCHT